MTEKQNKKIWKKSPSSTQCRQSCIFTSVLKYLNTSTLKTTHLDLWSKSIIYFKNDYKLVSWLWSHLKAVSAIFVFLLQPGITMVTLTGSSMKGQVPHSFNSHVVCFVAIRTESSASASNTASEGDFSHEVKGSSGQWKRIRRESPMKDLQRRRFSRCHLIPGAGSDRWRRGKTVHTMLAAGGSTCIFTEV